MLAFIISSGFQLLQGFSGISPAIIAGAEPTTLTSLLIAVIMGSMMCLSAAIFAEKKPWDAIGLSMGGFFILGMTMCFSLTYFLSVPDFYLLRDFWTTFCLGAAFLVRFIQLGFDAYRIWRNKSKGAGVS